MVTGRRDEGFGQIREAQKLDPLSEYIGGHAAQHHFIAAEYDQAIEQDATLGRDQNRLGLARAYAMRGLYADALDQVEKARAQSRNAPVALADAGWIYGLRSDRSGAIAVAQELEELDRRGYVPPFLIALVYVGLRDNEKALNWLESGLSERDVYLITLMVDPRFDHLRSEPRFKILLRKMGFPSTS